VRRRTHSMLVFDNARPSQQISVPPDADTAHARLSSSLPRAIWGALIHPHDWVLRDVWKRSVQHCPHDGGLKFLDRGLS
jgi:hypothetical protein